MQLFQPTNITKNLCILAYERMNNENLQDSWDIYSDMWYEISYRLNNGWRGDIVINCGDCSEDAKKYFKGYIDKSFNRRNKIKSVKVPKEVDNVRKKEKEKYISYVREFYKKIYFINYTKKEYFELMSGQLVLKHKPIHPLSVLLVNENVKEPNILKVKDIKILLGYWAYDNIGVEIKKTFKKDGFIDITEKTWLLFDK